MREGRDFKLLSGVAELPPSHIVRIANLHEDQRILAWTTVNPYHDVGCYVCSRVVPPMMVCFPCFWPHLVLLSPCFCNMIVVETNRINSEYWILTDSDLKIVNVDYNQCCLPGCWTSGDTVKTIPLDKLTDCGSDQRGTGLCNVCSSDLPTLYVDTASSGANQKKKGISAPGSNHEGYGIGLTDSDGFLKLLMQQRRNVNQQPHQMNMVRGGTAKERIREAQELMEDGIITREQFERKKEEILASL